jgi:hypothetical protein
MINKHKKITNNCLIVTVFMTAWLGLCGSAFAQGENMESSYKQTLGLALQANEKVMVLEHQWTTVPVLLKQAEDAAGEKDFARANEFAAEALKHAELGIEQAEQQGQRWVNAVPR